MKERANAVLFIAIALILVTWWVWPKAYMPIGDLHNRDIIAAQFRDATGVWFHSTDSLIILRSAHQLDQVESIPEVNGRQSKGFFEVVFELVDGDPIRIEVLCHNALGPVIHRPGDFDGQSLDSLVFLLERAFPEGTWCTSVTGHGPDGR